MKTLVSVVLAAVLLLAVFLPAGAQTCAVQYTVKTGDTLFRIGVQFGVPWPAIAAANSLANPNLIFAGQVLCIPAAGTAMPTATRTPTGVPGPTATRTPTGVPPTTVPAPGGPFVIPTFTIVSVVRNTSVTIQTANFPPNQTFNVLMGPIGTRGVGGFAAGTVNSGAGGAFSTTLAIPAGMANAAQIAVGLYSASGYYSYNWFWNNTFP
jgi:hypothetical protein